MANVATTQPNRTSSMSTWMIGAGVVAIIVLLGVIITILMGMQKATPEEIAKQYVNDNIDLLGEQVAGFLLQSDGLLKEIGGEYVEDQIHRVIAWDYSTAEPLSNGRYEVIASASVDFDVDIPLATGNVAANLPFIIVVDHDTQQVVSSNPDIIGASFSSDILPNVSLDDAKDKADETLDKANDTLDKARKLLNN